MRKNIVLEYEHESARNCAMRMQRHHSNLSLRSGDFPMLPMLQYPALVYSVGSVHPSILPVFPHIHLDSAFQCRWSCGCFQLFLFLSKVVTLLFL